MFDKVNEALAGRQALKTPDAGLPEVRREFGQDVVSALRGGAWQGFPAVDSALPMRLIFRTVFGYMFHFDPM
ncbi:hypothetical protein BH160DRAFT_0690 [Burkholderia sp. H160]|nr:hypothetical protein BH160DRAFT_0690 [Burkholderia sp. H160]